MSEPGFIDNGDPQGRIQCQFLMSSGLSFNHCVTLGRRFPEDVGPVSEESDYWIIVNRKDPDGSTLNYSKWSYKNMLTGIWCSPTGRVYVADATLGGVHVYEDVLNAQRRPIDYEFPNDVGVEGVWGLSDECVFAWGLRVDLNRVRTYPCFRFDGTEWTELPGLPRAVSAIHGCDPTTVYAAGWGGLIARWDGSRWVEFPTPTGEILVDIHVESWDEMYAVGEQGIFLEGSASGWGFAGSNPLGPVRLSSVAKYGNDVLVGGYSLGLMKRSPGGGSLEMLRADIETNHLESGSTLLICGDTDVIGTTDLQTFSKGATDAFARLTQNIPIMPL